MKQDLTLNVGTKYDGEGMKKLNSAVSNTAKTVGSASRALQSVSAELNQIGGKAGQAAGAIGGLFQSFSQGGLAALAVTAITGAVGLLVSAFQKAKEAAADAADALRKSFDKAVQKTVEKIGKIKTALGFAQRQNAVEHGFEEGKMSIAQKQSRLDIRNRYATLREQATSELDRTKIDAAEKRDLAVNDAKWAREEARRNAANQSVNVQPIAEARDALAQAYAAQAEEVAKQKRSIERNPLTQKYQKLKDSVEHFAEVLKTQGEDAVVDTKTVTSTSFVSGAVIENTRTYNVTAKEKYEELVQKLKELTENSPWIEASISSHENNLKTLEKTQADLARANQDVTEAENKVKLTNEQKRIADEEYATAVKAAEQQYKDDIKKAKDAAKQKAEAEKKAKEAEKKQQEAALKAAKEEEKKAKRNELQKQLDNLTEAQRKTALQQLDERRAEAEAAKQLAEAEKKAKAVLEDWADNKKQGAGAWGRGQDAEAAAKMRQAEAERGNVAKAQKDAANLAGAIFNADGDIRGTARAAQIGKFAQLSDYLGGKNLTDEQKQSLQSAAEKLRAKVFDDKGNLKVSHGSQELKNFNRIQKILDKMKAVDEAKKLQAEAKKREEQNARIQEQQFQAVKDIRDKMKDLGV